MGKTLGIIGFGNTGSALAKCLSGFQMKILAYDKYKSGFGNEKVKECEMHEIFEHADILSFHVPLTEETRFLVNKSFISLFNKKIWLLNLSRGEVVRTTDLIWGLQSGKIIGAGLDVLENEKIQVLSSLQKMELETLLAMNNVIITPHIGGWSFESQERIMHEIESQILDFQSRENQTMGPASK